MSANSVRALMSPESFVANTCSHVLPPFDERQMPWPNAAAYTVW